MVKLLALVVVAVVPLLSSAPDEVDDKPRFPAFHCKGEVWCKTGDFCCPDVGTCVPHKQGRPARPGCGIAFGCDDTTCAAGERCDPVDGECVAASSRFH